MSIQSVGGAFAVSGNWIAVIVIIVAFAVVTGLTIYFKNVRRKR
jgi:hypothetical protein